MQILVLGAGIVGIATAYELIRDGHDVAVIDRQPGPAREASYANGGQISANHATPWATPSAPLTALRSLGRTDAPLLYHMRLDPALWRWTAQFLRNCTRIRMMTNIERALRVAVYSRRRLQAVRQATAIHYDEREEGILHIFRDHREFERALPQVEPMNRLGCTRRIVDAAECVAIEPALEPRRQHLVGGIVSPDDETGDAHLFGQRLADHCTAEGARFSYATTIERVIVEHGRVAAVETDHGRFAADAVVIALGSHTPRLLRPLGLRVPIYPAKGYSVTLSVNGTGLAPTVGLIDDEVKMVYARLGDRLRVAGTAEFTGYDETVSRPRAQFLLDRALELFPGSCDPTPVDIWTGLRPSTPDGVPVIGATSIDGLFLNCGHGTLGWTMACGSARLIADIIAGRTPEVDIDGLGMERFR